LQIDFVKGGSELNRERREELKNPPKDRKVRDLSEGAHEKPEAV